MKAKLDDLKDRILTTTKFHFDRITHRSPTRIVVELTRGEADLCFEIGKLQQTAAERRNQTDKKRSKKDGATIHGESIVGELATSLLFDGFKFDPKLEPDGGIDGFICWDSYKCPGFSVDVKTAGTANPAFLVERGYLIADLGINSWITRKLTSVAITFSGWTTKEFYSTHRHEAERQGTTLYNALEDYELFEIEKLLLLNFNAGYFVKARNDAALEELVRRMSERGIQ